MKKTLQIIFTILFPVIIYCQDLPQIIPPSPEAFELTKYGEIPINESSGMANIKVPLFDYSIVNISSSVYLDYNTSGIKVDQVASWVGMGWNLKAGGVITRNVRGKADELYQKEYGQSFEDLRNLYFQDDIEFYKFLLKIGQGDNRDEDFEPDLYSFNVRNLSGAFILYKNSQPILIDRNINNIKISII